MKKLFVFLLWALICPQLAFAQGPVSLCYTTDGQNCIKVSNTLPLPVTSQCASSAIISVSSGTTAEIVALTTGQIIKVCSIVLTADTIATTAKFVYGTGANCAGGPADITGAMRLQDEGNISISAPAPLFRTLVSNALCLTTATGAVTGFITYTKN